MKHFTITIIKTLAAFASLAREKGNDDVDIKLRGLKEGLATASRWDIKDIRNLWDIDLSTVDFSKLWIPYDHIALEYEFPIDMLDPKGSLAKDPDSGELGRKRVTLAGKIPYQDAMAIFSFWYSEKNGMWTFCPVTTRISRENLENAQEWLPHKGTKQIITTYNRPTMHAVVSSLDDLEKRGYDDTAMSRDTVDEIRVVMALMAMLTCANIEVQTEKPKKWLNARRKKHGKPEIPPYHTIVIHHNKATLAAHAAAAEEERTHASPRPHWRRGHKRTYASGKDIWVRPCKIHGGTDDLPEYETL